MSPLFSEAAKKKNSRSGRCLPIDFFVKSKAISCLSDFAWENASCGETAVADQNNNMQASSSTAATTTSATRSECWFIVKETQGSDELPIRYFYLAHFKKSKRPNTGQIVCTSYGVFPAITEGSHEHSQSTPGLVTSHESGQVR